MPAKKKMVSNRLVVKSGDRHIGNVKIRTKPSNNPSPVVAQLGTTNQILSFSWVSFNASVTSCGFMAINMLVYTALQTNLLMGPC